MLPSTKLVLSVSMVILILEVNGEGSVFPNECRTCKPGYYALKKCNEHHDTICAPCPEGLYMPDHNIADQCWTCSTCGQGLYKAKQCNGRHDTLCASCDQKDFENLSSYKTFCVKNMMSDEASPSEDMGSIGTINLETGSGEDSGIVLEPEPELVPTVISRNSSTSPVHDKVTPEPEYGEIKSENVTDEVQGSGDFPSLEISTENDTIDSTVVSSPEPLFTSTLLPSSSSSLSPHIDDVTDEGFIPAGKKNYTTNVLETTTPEVTVAKLLSTVRVAKTTQQPSTTTESPEQSTTTQLKTTTTTKETSSTTEATTKLSLTTTEATTTTTTTAFVIKTLPPIDGGIILPGTDKPNKGGDYIITPNPVENNDNGKQDTRKRPTAEATSADMSDETDGVTIGIIVAVVVVVAILIIIIGILVSRYCKRNRGSFQVKKGDVLEHKNGAPLSKSYHDSEKGSGIYDEIGKETPVRPQNNGKPNGAPNGETIVPASVDDVYAVPDKRKKNSDGSPKIDEQLDVIKFIDETTDDELDAKEGDRLLEETENDANERHASQASIPNGSVRHSKDMDQDDETSPLVANEDKDSTSDQSPSPSPEGQEEEQQGSEERGLEDADQNESMTSVTNESDNPLIGQS